MSSYSDHLFNVWYKEPCFDSVEDEKDEEDLFYGWPRYEIVYGYEEFAIENILAPCAFTAVCQAEQEHTDISYWGCEWVNQSPGTYPMTGIYAMTQPHHGDNWHATPAMIYRKCIAYATTTKLHPFVAVKRLLRDSGLLHPLVTSAVVTGLLNNEQFLGLKKHKIPNGVVIKQLLSIR